MSISYNEAQQTFLDPAWGSQYATVQEKLAALKSLVSQISGEVYATDAAGNYVLDGNGNPIPSQANRLLYSDLLPD